MSLGRIALGREALGRAGGATAATVAVGQATETDSALALTVKVGAVVVVGQATETDSALAATTKTGVLVVVGQATETDSALTVTVTDVTPLTIAVGQATETDAAQTALTHVKIAVGQVTETDEALALGTIHVRVPVGQATETDSTFAARTITVVHVGQATETDEAFTVNVDNPLGTFYVHVGQATEADSAGAVTISAGYADTDTANNVYAVMFSGDADVIWEPAVEARPALLINGASQISARKYDDFDIATQGQAAFVGDEVVNAPALRDRILIGNTDWTYRHGLLVETPDFELLEPGAYGDGGTLTLPSINARFERLGEGRLKRVKLGAKVVYQQVDDDPTSPTYNEVVRTDYKGLILRQGRQGNKLTLAVGGELLGRASVKWHPAPIFRKVRDAGVQLYNSVVGLGLRYHPRLQHIGINLASRGGTWEDQYLLDTLGQLTTGDGEQWTLMPDDRGRYGAALKDRETINATVYLDNEFATEDLGDDLAEKPNRIWINAVAPDGQRIMHASAPLMQYAETPTRPLAFDPDAPDDTFAMNLGTVDENTTTGDGVTVLIWRLTFAGLLDRDDQPGGFDDDVAEALRDFQKSAGCANLTGTVDAETWNKLWDNDVVNYSVQYAAQRPAVQADEVQEFDRSGNGSIIGRHEGYDDTVVKVDLPLDMGMVASRRQPFKMAQHKLVPVGQEDFVGTITLTSGLIDGEHNPGDVLTADMVISNRAVRPGWNIWVPFFGAGDGTLFHVSACRIRNKGRTVELLVDTRARDAMEAWAVKQRNRDNRYRPSRYLGGDRRRSTASLDTVTPWDKIVGQTDRRWTLNPGWNRIPVPSGQVGTISDTSIILDKPAEFAVLVLEKDVPLTRLARKIDPLATPPTEPQRHRITISGEPTGGTFKLADDALDETADIAFDASASTVQTAVRGLGGGFSDATVVRSGSRAWTINMHGSEADIDVADNSLTGGTSPGISVTSAGPSTGDGTPWFRSDETLRWLKPYGFVVGWGSYKNPCGYGEGSKVDETGERTAEPLTGEHFDDGSFGYDCGLNGPELGVYIYLAEDAEPNALPRQRIFHQQLESGA